MKDRFPNYKPEQINSVVIVISDKTIYDELKDKQIVEVLKDQTDANNFFDKLQGFCKGFGFQIDGSGTREQMASRLFKKDGGELMTASEVLEFATDLNNQMLIKPNHIPCIKDVKNWIEKRDQRVKEENKV